MTESPVNEKLAKTSLVLGILSVMGCLFAVGVLTAIPAIITGHLARSRARRFPEQFGGSRKALTGLSLGYFVVGCLVLAVTVAVPNFRRARLTASWPVCVERLEKTGRATIAYAEQHDGRFPSNLLSLSNLLVNPINLVCPALREYPDWTENVNWSQIDTRWFTVELLATGAVQTASSNRNILRCPRHGHTVLGSGQVQPDDTNRPQPSR
jgi:hypothetical protein